LSNGGSGVSAAGCITKVAIAGGGITAWSAAAALKRRIPQLEIELISTPPAQDALADRIISTLPAICQFHRDIGLTEADTVTAAGSGLRLGTLMQGWSDNRPDYIHAYGPCGVPTGGVAFHQLWLRESAISDPPSFDQFSPTAERARLGAPPQSSSEWCAFGLQLTLERYGEMMRAYALHLGVRERLAAIRHVVLRPDTGFIDSVALADESSMTADLFVDCTGPSALLHRSMGGQFVDWSAWLPCDRVMLTCSEADRSSELMDRLAAVPFGWRWMASSPQQGSAGLVYSSAHASNTDAAAQLAAGIEPLVIHQGRKRDFWIRNCVAIGDAAVTVEPLEWTNLHLVHSQLDRLVDMMPGQDCADMEIAQFNDESAAEADRVRDFLCLHYVCSARPEPFWRDVAAITPPRSLEHTLSLFKERGRLPYYQEETFSRDSWLTVLLGQGIRPRRIDPLADIVSRDEAAQAFAAMRQSLKSFTLPSRPDLLELNPHGIR
jgi:tryptophan halogenase